MAGRKTKVGKHNVHVPVKRQVYKDSDGFHYVKLNGKFRRIEFKTGRGWKVGGW